MDTWIFEFDQQLKRFFGIDHIDAGLDEQRLALYRDLKPEEAALLFGVDYDLDRISAANVSI